MRPILFSQMHPQAFAHPDDRRATSAFEQFPLVPDLLKKISQLGTEEIFRKHHMHNSVKLGAFQFPSLYRMVDNVAKRLGIEPPVTYVSRQGEANAFAFGRHTPSIVLTSELVDLLSDRELQGVIAHEMGHILCQHMLYMDVGLALTNQAVPAFSKLPGVQETIHSLFFAWFRAAEYSADRAALLILEDPEPLTECLCRLAGVPHRLEAEEFDLLLFIEQAKEYTDEATLWSKIVTFGMGRFLTHPEPVKRVAAILEWAKSEEYRKILGGCYLTKFEVEALEQVQIQGVQSCPLCRRPVAQAAVCGHCALPQDPRQQKCCPCGHTAANTWKFCKACGADLKQDSRST